MTLSVMIFPLAKVVFLMLTPLVGVASLVPFSEKYSTRAMAEWLLLPFYFLNLQVLRQFFSVF